MQAPCKDCSDRVLGCHSTCEKYKAFQEYRKNLLEKKAKENRMLNDWMEARRNSKNKPRW